MRSVSSSSLGAVLYRPSAAGAIVVNSLCTYTTPSRPLYNNNNHKANQYDIKGGFGDRVPKFYNAPLTSIDADMAFIDGEQPTPIGSNSCRGDIKEEYEDGPTTVEYIDLNVVLVEETAVPGILMIRMNHAPVNTLTMPVMRTLRYYLELAADSAERRLGSGRVGPGVPPPRTQPNPWAEMANEKKNHSLDHDPAARHDELVKLFKGVRGLVLSSALKNVYCAGLDLDELLKVGERSEHLPLCGDDEDAMFSHYASFTTYWGEFQTLWLTLHTLPIPIIAAINGDAPAGGCILGMCCDYRVMAIGSAPTPSITATNSSTPTKPQRKYKIGITAARAGFWLPKFVGDHMRSVVVSSRAAEEILSLGLMIPSEEALSSKYGLVDALSDTDETVITDAIEVAKRWAGLCDGNEIHEEEVFHHTHTIPHQHTYWLVKYDMRTEFVSQLDTKAKRLDDVFGFITMLSSPSVHQALKTYRESLFSKKKH